ncbi:Fe-S cluster assembly protein SufD, partial [Maricaulis sp. CAU 1757]
PSPPPPPRAVLERGLPTRRAEAWKWSDLRRATQDISTRGEAGFVLDGMPAPAAVTLTDGGAHALDLTATAGVSVAAIEIQVPAGASARIVERQALEAGAFATVRIEYTLGEGASLERVVLPETPDDAVAAIRTRLVLAPGARLNQTTLSFGGKLSRQETHVTHPGEGAEVSLGGVYLLAEGRQADFTSTVTHTGPGGVTRQLVKGAAMAHARGVFQGKFAVERAAQQTDARMTHRALMLDERAEIDAKPELEIYADDVQCAHGNALGTLDETALFYMRQRGLPEAKARALLIESYLAEPLDAVRDADLRDTLKALLRDRLEALT